MLAQRMAPMRESYSHVFWRIATGVHLYPTVKVDWTGYAYFVGDAWAAWACPVPPQLVLNRHQWLVFETLNDSASFF